MTKETITQVILKPSEGMVLTDGKNFAPTVAVLPESVDTSDWYEITEAEYEKIMAEELPAPEIVG